MDLKEEDNWMPETTVVGGGRNGPKGTNCAIAACTDDDFYRYYYRVAC
jgi:hypothetical protein